MKWIIRIAAAIAGVLILAAAALLFLGSRPGAGAAHSSIDIAATPQQVWTWIDEPAKLQRWISWVVEVKTPGPIKSGVGAKRILVMKDENNGGMLIEVEGICTRYQPPQLMSLTLSSPGMFSGRQTYRLTDLGGGKTRMDLDSDYKFEEWFAKLMSPLVMSAARQKMVGDLAHLKSLAEQI